MFECWTTRRQTVKDMIRLKEFDGGRDVHISSDPDSVYLEVAGHCYQFDRAIFARAVTQALAMAAS
ncbi:hypothetical protein AOA12_06120 [Microbacterium sp. No. 7]|nr:hypothetical protein AOA12_06120 [Microbacterium sp. No. 7]